MWVSSRTIGSPNLLTISQSLFLAAGIVAMASAVHRLGGPSRVVVGATAVLALTPMVGGFSISLWKDVPYAATFLFVSARVVDLVRGRLDGKPLAVDRALWSMGRWLVLLIALRQNGILVAGALIVLMATCMKVERRRLIAIFGACCTGLLLFKAVVYPMADIRSSGSQPFLFPFLHDIAHASQVHPAVIGPDDRRLLEHVAPMAHWLETYQRFGCPSAAWQLDPAFHWDQIEGQTNEYLALWLKIFRSDPLDVIRHRLCVGAVTWRPDNVGVLYTTSRGIDQNPYGLRTAPLLGFLDDGARAALDAADKPGVQWITWRAPTWIYLAYLLVGLAACRRRQPLVALVTLPLLALQLGVLMANPAQDARYMFPGLLVALLLLPLSMAPLQKGRIGSG